MNAADGGLERAIELVQSGDFAAAWRAAIADESPLGRAQGELHVRHHAGDLPGALAAGERGLVLAPRDPWLRERCAYIAVSLRDVRAAERHVRALASALDVASAADRARYQRTALELGQQTDELRAAARARSSALGRARALALAFALASIAALVLVARR